MADVATVRELMALRRLDDAVAEARRQLDARPGDAELSMWLALGLGRLGHQEAVPAAEAAHRLAPDDFWMTLSLSEVYRRGGLPRPAAETAQRAAQMAPGTLEPMLAIGWACTAYDREAGIAASQAAIELAPNSVEAHRVRALYTSPIAAARLLERAVTLDPGNAELRAEYAAALQRSGRHAKAEQVVLSGVRPPTAPPVPKVDGQPDLEAVLISTRHERRRDERESGKVLGSHGVPLAWVGLVVTGILIFLRLVSL